MMGDLAKIILASVLMLAGMRVAQAQVQGAWTVTGSLNTPRDLDAQAAIGAGRVVVAGGVDASGGALASTELYTLAKGKWTAAGAMLAARADFPGLVLKNGKMLVSGGLGAGSVVLGGAELLDPKTLAWSRTGSLGVPRFAHTATLLADGRVLVAGGCLASGCPALSASSEIYDPAAGTWSPTGSLGVARANHTAVLLKSGLVLVVGGSGAGTSCELFNPATGTWSSAGSTGTARVLNATTKLPDGRVLASGGASGRYPIASTEIYDPATNAWAPAGSMVHGRYGHTATLLTDGTVLLAGGVGQSISCGKLCTSYIPFADVEIYSEAGGTFTGTASLNRALAYHSTTLLGTGQALTAGGSGYNTTCCQVAGDAQSYAPLTLRFSAGAVDFGFLQLGLTAGPRTITLTNVSPHGSAFKSIAAAGDYAQTNDCPASLGPSGSCTISVSFTPKAAGSRPGAITLHDDDPGSPRQTIALSGTGAALALAFSPASLDLGSVPVTTTSTQSTILINDGAAPVSISAIAIAPGGAFRQGNNCPAMLAVQQSCTAQVTFAPPDVGTYRATLSVANSAGAAATLALSGVGLDSPQASGRK